MGLASRNLYHGHATELTGFENYFVALNNRCPSSRLRCSAWVHLVRLPLVNDHVRKLLSLVSTIPEVKVELGQ